MGKMKHLHADIKCTSFLYGINHQKTNDLAIVWEFANNIGSMPNKKPEDSMLMHSIQVILRNLNFKIYSVPKEMDT